MLRLVDLLFLESKGFVPRQEARIRKRGRDVNRAHRVVACHVVLAVVIMLVGVCGYGQTGEQISWETGLDQDLFATMRIDVQGVEVAVFFVYLNDRAFDSNISAGLAEKLRPYANRNALYVNVTVQGNRSWVAVDPSKFVVQSAGGDAMPAAEEAWVEITAGFVGGVLHPNPDDPSYGSGSIGVLLLGEAIDPERPFTIAYSGQEQRAVTLTVRAGSTASPAMSHGGEAVTDPNYEDPRQGSLGDHSIAVSFLDALLDEEVDREQMANSLGIQAERVHLIECGEESERLRLLLVELDGSPPTGLQAGADAVSLWETIAPLAGTGAVMVWAASATGAEFTPYAFYLQQAGSTFLFFSRSSFVDLTEGFTDQRRLAPGDVSAGIVLVHRRIDLQSPYTMHYCGVASRLGERWGDDGDRAR